MHGQKNIKLRMSWSVLKEDIYANHCKEIICYNSKLESCNLILSYYKTVATACFP